MLFFLDIYLAIVHCYHLEELCIDHNTESDVVFKAIYFIYNSRVSDFGGLLGSSLLPRLLLRLGVLGAGEDIIYSPAIKKKHSMIINIIFHFISKSRNSDGNRGLADGKQIPKSPKICVFNHRNVQADFIGFI